MRSFSLPSFVAGIVVAIVCNCVFSLELHDHTTSSQWTTVTIEVLRLLELVRLLIAALLGQWASLLLFSWACLRILITFLLVSAAHDAFRALLPHAPVRRRRQPMLSPLVGLLVLCAILSGSLVMLVPLPWSTMPATRLSTTHSRFSRPTWSDLLRAAPPHKLSDGSSSSSAAGSQLDAIRREVLHALQLLRSSYVAGESALNCEANARSVNFDPSRDSQLCPADGEAASAEQISLSVN